MKIIVLRTEADEKVISDIFDIALKAAGANCYSLIKHIDNLTKIISPVEETEEQPIVEEKSETTCVVEEKSETTSVVEELKQEKKKKVKK